MHAHMHTCMHACVSICIHLRTCIHRYTQARTPGSMHGTYCKHTGHLHARRTGMMTAQTAASLAVVGHTGAVLLVDVEHVEAAPSVVLEKLSRRRHVPLPFEKKHVNDERSEKNAHAAGGLLQATGTGVPGGCRRARVGRTERGTDGPASTSRPNWPAKPAGPNLGPWVKHTGCGPGQTIWAAGRPGPIWLRPVQAGPIYLALVLGPCTRALRSSPRSGRSAIPGGVPRRNRTPDR